MTHTFDENPHLFQVYILYSKKLNRFYVGYTTNLENRIKEHNSGEPLYTSQGMPWILLWWTSKSTYRQAEALEFKLKNLTRRRNLKFIQKYSKEVQDFELLRKLEQQIV